MLPLLTPFTITISRPSSQLFYHHIVIASIIIINPPLVRVLLRHSCLLLLLPLLAFSFTTTTTTTCALLMTATEVDSRIPVPGQNGGLSAELVAKVANRGSSLAFVISHPYGPLGGNLYNNVVHALAGFLGQLGQF